MKGKSKGESKARWSHPTLLVALCLLTYLNSCWGGFVWDDQFQIERNGFVRSIGNIPSVFTSHLWSFANSGHGNYYRPFQTTLYILTYQIGGLSPAFYHWVNIALHSIA